MGDQLQVIGKQWLHGTFDTYEYILASDIYYDMYILWYFISIAWQAIAGNVLKCNFHYRKLMMIKPGVSADVERLQGMVAIRLLQAGRPGKSINRLCMLCGRTMMALIKE